MRQQKKVKFFGGIFGGCKIFATLAIAYFSRRQGQPSPEDILNSSLCARRSIQSGAAVLDCTEVVVVVGDGGRSSGR